MLKLKINNLKCFLKFLKFLGKIPILKEFEWFEWFEWFGPSPTEPFNSGPRPPLVRVRVLAPEGCASIAR